MVYILMTCHSRKPTFTYSFLSSFEIVEITSLKQKRNNKNETINHSCPRRRQQAQNSNNDEIKRASVLMTSLKTQVCDIIMIRHYS